MSDSLVINSMEMLTSPSPSPIEVACDCCGLKEECTMAYIQRIQELYQGKWICGLCAEAVKDEAKRCRKRLISSEEALSRHLSFCKTFQSSSPPPNPTIHLITAMRQILRRSLESPKMRSTPCSPTKNPIGLSRSESCIPSLSLVDHHQASE